MVDSDRSPLLFISHKHADSRVADVLTDFVYKRTNRDVEVFQSSAADAKSPELGRDLTEQLKEALWQAGVVILVYTTEDQDWSWCMWECGVALKPGSPVTRIIILQCSTQAPRVFQNSIRVNARSQVDIQKFVTMFFTDPTFFPDLGRAVAPKLAAQGQQVIDASKELFESLARVVNADEVIERSIQPLLQLQLSLDVVDKLRQEAASAGPNKIQVADMAAVSHFDQRAAQIFGLNELPPGLKLSGLALRWTEGSGAQSLGWVRDVETQLRHGARDAIPTIGWDALQGANGGISYVPVLSRSRRLPALKCLEFDISLVPFDQLAATSVTARMLRVNEIACHRIQAGSLAELKLVELVQRFKNERLTRMPFLTDDDRIQLVVHRSMIDRYIAEVATSGNGVSVSSLSFSDLLVSDPELKSLFETSFAVVAESARLRDVKVIIGGNSQIQDVFVTRTGNRDEPITGWITNAMLAQYS